MVGHRGIEANPVKIDAIGNMAKTSCKKEVMKLNGMMAALGRFISKLGKKGLPFFKLLKKADKFVWTKKHRRGVLNHVADPDTSNTEGNTPLYLHHHSCGQHSSHH
jgi:hypothetical protein